MTESSSVLEKDTSARKGRVARPIVLMIIAGWALTVLWHAWQLEGGRGDEVGPAAVPVALATLLLLLIAADLVRFRRSPGSDPHDRSHWQVPAPLVLFTGTVVLSFAVMNLAGFGLGLALLILICAAGVERLRPLRAVLTTVLILGVLYVVFVSLLQVPIELLPQ